MTKDAYRHKRIEGAGNGPLLFLFHGTGGDETQLIELAEIVPGATIVAPRGDVREGASARFFRRTAEGVYDMADLERATEKMISFMRAHVGEGGHSFVAGLGYSNGANILAATLFAEPALFDAAVLMHPLIPFVPRICGPLSQVRILITAGSNDPICPPDLTTRLESYLRAAGGEPVLEWHQGGHEMRQQEIEAAERFLASVPTSTERIENDG